MKLLTVSAIALVTALSNVHADLVIVQQMNSNASGMNMDMEMAMKFKDDLIRVDVGDQSTTIINGKSSEIINIVHAQKMVMKMDSNQISAMQEQFQKSTENEGNQSDSELKPTGESKEINGYQTEEYIQNKDGTEIRYWIAIEYPGKANVLAQMSKIEDSNIGKMSPGKSGTNLKDFPGVPIQTVVKQGGQLTTITVKSIEEKDVDASEFEIPEGYSEMNMPSMGDMLKKAKPE